MHDAIVVVFKAVGRVLHTLLVEVHFELWKNKSGQISCRSTNCVEFELFVTMTLWVAVRSGINLNDVSERLVASVFRNMACNILTRKQAFSAPDERDR